MATVSISIALELSGITGQLPLLLTVCGSCPEIPDNCIRLQFVTGIFNWLQFVANWLPSYFRRFLSTLCRHPHLAAHQLGQQTFAEFFEGLDLRTILYDFIVYRLCYFFKFHN